MLTVIYSLRLVKNVILAFGKKSHKECNSRKWI
jgi:hypothetical protein